MVNDCFLNKPLWLCLQKWICGWSIVNLSQDQGSGSCFCWPCCPEIQRFSLAPVLLEHNDVSVCSGVWYTSHAESVSWDHLLQLFTFVPVVKLRNTRPIQMLTQEAFCRHHMLSCIWFGVMLHLSVLSWLRPCRLSTSLSMVVQKHKITDSVHKRLSRNLSMATQCANATLTRVAL